MSWGKMRVGSDAHRDVNVFEDATRCDAEDSIAGFHQVIALTAAVLSAQMIGEAEAGIELFGLD